VELKRKKYIAARKTTAMKAAALAIPIMSPLLLLLLATEDCDVEVADAGLFVDTELKFALKFLEAKTFAGKSSPGWSMNLDNFARSLCA
jgi:hypothetical protein